MEKISSKIKDPSLLSQTGYGPWEKSKGGWRYDKQSDLQLLEQSGFNDVVAVQKPDRKSNVEIDKGFFRIPDLQTYFFGINYQYDLFTTQEFLDRSLNKSPDEANLQKILKEKSVIPWRSIVTDSPFSLLRSLEQIRFMSIQFPEHASTEAMILLHNLAKRKKRIAVFLAHGTPWSNNHLHVKNNEGKLINANTLINEISNEYGSFLNKRYEGIYFSSCNRNVKLQTQGTVEAKRIPVVIHTGVHWMDSEVAPAMVYWP